MNAEIEVLLELIRANNQAAVDRHNSLDVKVTTIDNKVTALIHTSSFSQGAGKAILYMAGLVSAVVGSIASVLIGWFLRSH